MAHYPVLLQESVDALNITPSGTYVDATFGGGGHSKQILNQLNKEGRLVAFDQDPEAAGRVFDDERFIFINENFRHIKRFLRLHQIKEVDGILADLGMSSFQLDDEERGFATRFDADLDMRMNKKGAKTAAHVLNTYSQNDLQDVFQNFGEVRNSRSLAKLIVEQRENEAFTTTNNFIERIDFLIRGNKNRYLAQVFQALRIEVNEEMKALQEFLQQGAELLVAEGRFSVITFHSLEDRAVKHFFKTGTFDGKVEKDIYGRFTTPLKVVNKKPILPSEEELSENARSRSAKLRIATK